MFKTALTSSVLAVIIAFSLIEVERINVDNATNTIKIDITFLIFLPL